MTSQIRVDEITNRSGLGTVTIYDNGFEFTGVTTFTEDVDITGGLTIGGVLTYEDVTNIDSVGVVTARAGIRVTGDSIHVESSEDRLLYLKSTDANAYLTFEDTDSSSGFANRVGTVSDGLYFSTGGGGERLRIDSSGRVLIGRTSPLASSAEKLTIDSGMAIFRRNSTNAAALYIRNEDTTADTRQPYLIFTDGGGNRGGFGCQYNESSLWISGQGGIAFRTGGSAPSTTERLRITSAGRIGINEATPDAQLHVKGSGNSSGLTFLSEDSSGNNTFWIQDGGKVGVHYYPFVINRDYNDTIPSSTYFYVHSGTPFAIKNDGKIHVGGDGTGTDQINVIAAGGGINISRQNSGSPSVNEWLGALGFKGYATGNSTAGADARIHANAAFNHSGTSAPANLIFSTKGTTEGPGNAPLERMRITYEGKVGINETSPTAFLDINHPNTEQGLVVRSRYGNIATAMVKFDADPDSNGGDGNVLHLHGGSSRTDSEILHVNSTGEGTCFQIRGDGRTRVYKQLQLEHASNVPKIIFNEYGANDIKAQIEMDQVSGSAGQLIFRTQNSGTLSERMRLLAGGGLTFNGDTAAANALDDYEEGTWTPTCASASSVSYSNQFGRYTKVGNCITIWWDLIWTSLSGTSNARIGGLPYTPVANTNQGGYGIPVFRDASGTNSDSRVYGNSSYFSTSGIKLQHYNSSGNPTTGSFNGSGRITGWAQYFDNTAY